MARKRFSAQAIELLLNQDGLCPKPPFKNRSDECRYYARYIEKMLWRSFTPEDWRRLAEIIDDVRVDPDCKRTTKFLIPRHVAES